MSVYLIWFLIGVGFLVAEFIMPTFIMFFFAIGAIFVSIITAFSDLSINFQIILFAISSIISLVLLRNYMKNIFKGFESKGQDNYFDNLEKIAIVSKAIDANTFGEIKYKGTFYKAQSKISIREGRKVKVVSKGDDQGSFFTVEELTK